MANKKKKGSAKSDSRPDSASGRLLTQAVSAINEVGKRVPPEWRQQVEKMVESTTKRFESRLNRAAQKGDLDRLAARLEQLARQVESLSKRSAEPARVRAPRSASVPAPRSTSTRRRTSRAASADATTGSPPAAKRARTTAPPRTRRTRTRSEKPPEVGPAGEGTS